MATGKILILSRTSSSGNTSIVRTLQGMLDEPYLDAGLDRFPWMLPAQHLREPLWDQDLGLAVEAGPVGNRLVTGMRHAIEALSRVGINVAGDHVLVQPGWLSECVHLYSDLPAYLIAVPCSLEILERREAGRTDRTVGQSRA